MKIWYEFPRPIRGPEKFCDQLSANWGKAGHADTELVIKSPSKGTAEFRYSIVGNLYADFLRSIEIVEGLVQAEKEGYDGAVIGCFADPGLNVLETLLDIPVMGPAKAAMIMAQTMGSKMAFITLPYTEKMIEKLIYEYRVQDSVLSYKPCRALNIPLEQFSEEDPFIKNFHKTAQGLVNDGADVIIFACVHCSTFLTYKGVTSVEGVPIVDGAIAALKLVEMMIKLKSVELWKSKKTITPDVMEGLRSAYYHGSESG